MEREKPGSCEAFIAKLIEQLGRYGKTLREQKKKHAHLHNVINHRIASNFDLMNLEKPLSYSSKEVSVKELQDMANRVFGKTNDAENKRKQATKEFTSNTNVSPLGRFLFSRFGSDFFLNL